MTACAVNLLEWETAEPTQGSGLEGDVLAGNPAWGSLEEICTVSLVLIRLYFASTALTVTM